MRKEEIIERFCALSDKVRDEVFDNYFPADCFCGKNNACFGNFQYDEEVIKYIEKAVKEYIKKEN